MQPFNIPWPFLDHTYPTEIQSKTIRKVTKTFAQALNNVCTIPESQLPQPCVKGGNLAIEIPEEEYLAGLNHCKHNLHGRILWPKGSTPLTALGLKNNLASMWKDLSRWGVTSIGKCNTPISRLKNFLK